MSVVLVRAAESWALARRVALRSPAGRVLVRVEGVAVLAHVEGGFGAQDEEQETEESSVEEEVGEEAGSDARALGLVRARAVLMGESRSRSRASRVLLCS